MLIRHAYEPLFFCFLLFFGTTLFGFGITLVVALLSLWEVI